MTPQELLFRFDGRLPRRTWWTAMLGLAVFSFAISFPVWDLIGGGERSRFWLMVILMAIAGWPATAVVVKRLHDLNRSGRLAAVFWAPYVLMLLGQLTGLSGTWTDVYDQAVFRPNEAGWALYAAGFAVAAWAALDLGGRRGTEGANQYGPDPLAPEPQT